MADTKRTVGYDNVCRGTTTTANLDVVVAIRNRTVLNENVRGSEVDPIGVGRGWHRNRRVGRQALYGHADVVPLEEEMQTRRVLERHALDQDAGAAVAKVDHIRLLAFG